MVKRYKYIKVKDKFEVDDYYLLDEFIDKLKEYPTGSTIEFELEYEDQGPIMAMVSYERYETEEERKTRLLREKRLREERERSKEWALAREKELYEKLKAKFEGPTL